MTFEFDVRGYLLPAQLIVADKMEIESFFVSNRTDSDTRYKLWKNFDDFINRFQREIENSFEIWLDGSFVLKKLNPKDIDAVFMLDYQVCERKKSVLESQWFTRENKRNLGLDLYYSIEYPVAHKRHFLTHLNHLYWIDLYGYTRKDAIGQQFQKGFIYLKI